MEAVAAEAAEAVVAAVAVAATEEAVATEEADTEAAVAVAATEEAVAMEADTEVALSEEAAATDTADSVEVATSGWEGVVEAPAGGPAIGGGRGGGRFLASRMRNVRLEPATQATVLSKHTSRILTETHGVQRHGFL